MACNCYSDNNINENEVRIMAVKQTEANKRWQEKNKERAKYLSDRSRARSFIKNLATLEDLEEFEKLIEEKKLSYIK